MHIHEPFFKKNHDYLEVKFKWNKNLLHMDKNRMLMIKQFKNLGSHIKINKSVTNG